MDKKLIKFHMKFIKPMLKEGLTNREISKRYGYTQGYIRKIISEYNTHFLKNQEKLYMQMRREESRRLTLKALNRLKIEGIKLGRPKGIKDKKPRRKVGYSLRYEEKENVL